MKDMGRSYKIYLILSVAVCCTAAVFMTVFAGKQGFWLDELFNIGIAGKGISFSELIRSYITSEVTNPPLYAVFLYFWYRIAPYGEVWLLLPNIVFWAIGTVALLKAVHRTTEDMVAVFIAACFSSVSVFMVNCIVWELRNYTMMYMFAALVLYFYVRTRYEQSIKNYLLLGIIMVLLAFIHYFGDLMIALIAFYELLLFLKGRNKIRFVIPYIMCIVTMGPFFTIMLINREKNLKSFWIGRPGIMSVMNTIVTLLGNKWGAIFFAVAGISAFITVLRRKEADRATLETASMAMAVAAGEFVLVFVYSSFVNPKGSVWLVRYFIVLMPLLFFICAYGMHVLLKGRAKIWNTVLCILLPVMLIAGSAGNFVSLARADNDIIPDNVNTKTVAGLIKSDSAGKNNVLVISSYASYFEKGWEEYYFPGSSVDLMSAGDYRTADIADHNEVWLFTPHSEAPEALVSELDGKFKNKKEFKDMKLIRYEK